MAKATQTMTITLPIELKTQITNLQQQVDEYKKALEKVDPGSIVGKKITRSLTSTQNQVENLITKAKQPFRSSKELDAFTSQIEKVGNSVQRIGVQFDGLKFSDLRLDPEQSAQFERLAEDANMAQKALSDFYKAQLSGMRTSSSANNNFFKSAGIDTSDNIEKVISKIDKALSKMRESAALAGTQLQEALTQQTGVEEEINVKKNFIEKASGNARGFFRSDGSFNSNAKYKGKEDLLNQMENYGFSQSDIEKVKEMTSKQVKEFFSGIREGTEEGIVGGELLKARENAKNQVAKAQTLYNTTQSRVQTGEQIQNQVNGVVSSQQVEVLTQTLKEATQTLQAFQTQTVNTAKGSEDVKKAQEELRNTLDNSADGIRAVSAEMRQLEQRQQALSNIQMVVSRWFGFTQVVNMVKSAVKGMITEIKGLDEVITQIAVVTDMTQKDLWAQMDTYSALAQKYGTTIKGVYQVSQLYYQLLVA